MNATKTPADERPPPGPDSSAPELEEHYAACEEDCTTAEAEVDAARERFLRTGSVDDEDSLLLARDKAERKKLRRERAAALLKRAREREQAAHREAIRREAQTLEADLAADRQREAARELAEQEAELLGQVAEVRAARVALADDFAARARRWAQIQAQLGELESEIVVEDGRGRMPRRVSASRGILAGPQLVIEQIGYRGDLDQPALGLLMRIADQLDDESYQPLARRPSPRVGPGRTGPEPAPGPIMTPRPARSA